MDEIKIDSKFEPIQFTAVGEKKEDIRIINLITGEQLLAKAIEANITSLTIENPVRIIIVPNKMDPGAPQIAFGPWAQFTKEKRFTLQWAHIIASYEAIDQFKTQYRSMFSGIITNQKNLILPGA